MRLRTLRFSLSSAIILSLTGAACSHKDSPTESSEVSVTDEAVSRPVAETPEPRVELKPVPAPKAVKRTEAAAARNRAAVVETARTRDATVESAPDEGSEEEYAADVDAAMGDTAAPAEAMSEENAVAVNSEADNSRVNRLNDGDVGLTADQQGNSKSDVEITRKIRKMITDKNDLSIYARNVKIITREGRVVLKGPVRSEAERRFIEDTAVTVAGSNNVASGIEIAK